ncbi:MAG: hypothetical protein ACREYE_05845 [Gammaproteobacteria bacterium]
MSETIAITGKSVKLFKGHYTRSLSDLGDGTRRVGNRRQFFDHLRRIARSIIDEMIGK